MVSPGKSDAYPLPLHQKGWLGTCGWGGPFPALREGKGLPSLGMADWQDFGNGLWATSVARWIGFTALKIEQAPTQSSAHAHRHERRGLAGSEHGGIRFPGHRVLEKSLPILERRGETARSRAPFQRRYALPGGGSISSGKRVVGPPARRGAKLYPEEKFKGGLRANGKPEPFPWLAERNRRTGNPTAFPTPVR